MVTGLVGFRILMRPGTNKTNTFSTSSHIRDMCLKIFTRTHSHIRLFAKAQGCALVKATATDSYLNIQMLAKHGEISKDT